MTDNALSDKFNDPANAKFVKLWEREADIADDFEMGANWFQRWTGKRDGFAAAGNPVGVENAQALVDYWDEWLVKAAARLAKHKNAIESGKDSLSAEFNAKSLTQLTPLYEALSKLDDTQIKSGKEIFKALVSIMTDEPAPAPEPKKPGPLDNGNPFKKGPTA